MAIIVIIWKKFLRFTGRFIKWSGIVAGARYLLGLVLLVALAMSASNEPAFVVIRPGIR